MSQTLTLQKSIQITNEDNMELMSRYKDKYFDLAIVDPPYGINHSEIAGKQSGTKYGKAAAAKKEYTVKDWDKNAPNQEYFDELFRVSKNQIIWGANYMTDKLPPSMGWIFWDKDNGTNGFSDGELAYTSFNKGLRKIKITWNGMIQYNMKNKEDRIHPTQKPIALYQWLLTNYAKEGDKILDTHIGSGSIAIALDSVNKVEKMNLTLRGSELDLEYYEKTMSRIKDKTSWQSLF